MPPRTAFALRDLVALIVLAAVGGILVGVGRPHGPSPVTLSNLRLMGQAAGQYQGDNNQYLPMTLTYTRGTAPAPGVTLEGWCNWSFGGKNNNAFWANRPFDCEAADRPLNRYVIPDEGFYAPPSPARLPATDPARTRAEAPMFRDPADAASYERNWPQPTPGITGYDDIGTSYLFNVAWWDQLSSISNFVSRFNEGTRRIAQHEGVDPARFVWLTDQYGDNVVNMFNPNYRIVNGLGDVNWAPMLILDGHVIYASVRPRVYNTPAYQFRFTP